MITLDEIVAALKEIVGPRFVSTNPIDKINYQHTLAYGAYRALPDVIVRVESDANGKHSVAKILRFANEHKIPIVAKGGVGMGIFSAVWMTTLQQHVPEEALSRVSAWDWMGSFLFLPLGLVAAGPVSDLIGISATLWISVTWAVLSTLVVVLVPSVRNLRRVDVPERREGALAQIPGEPAEAFHGG